MLCQGKPQYGAVREMMDDPDYYKVALGVAYAIPSVETLRQRFDMVGDSLRKDIQQANIEMLREMKIEPSALENGYAPVMAYIGTEGYLVNLELRIGKQHCQKDTPDFLRETIIVPQFVSFPR